jgi:uncharacterized protein YqjF (DUF2071 family)
MSLAKVRDTLHYTSQRRNSKLGFRGNYQPSGDVYAAVAGSLEHFLTERYCLYAKAPDGRLLRNEVHHAPWPLQRAEAEVLENTMFSPLRIPALTAPPLLHFARRIDVVVWSAEACLVA